MGYPVVFGLLGLFLSLFFVFFKLSFLGVFFFFFFFWLSSGYLGERWVGGLVMLPSSDFTRTPFPFHWERSTTPSPGSPAFYASISLLFSNPQNRRRKKRAEPNLLKSSYLNKEKEEEEEKSTKMQTKLTFSYLRKI